MSLQFLGVKLADVIFFPAIMLLKTFWPWPLFGQMLGGMCIFRTQQKVLLRCCSGTVLSIVDDMYSCVHRV